MSEAQAVQGVGRVRRPADERALVAIDLGAESCRVSLLRWVEGGPRVQVIHRFANHARERDGGLRWDMAAILRELEYGLRQCAVAATEGVRSIGVDGWAVDYVRLGDDGVAVGDPYCYRDERSARGEAAMHTRIPAERMRELTGIQLMALNSVYQMASEDAATLCQPWLNLPEYVLYKLGGRPIAEFSNATHTQMVGLDGGWCGEVVEALGVPPGCMPEIVAPGTDVGELRGVLTEMAAFRGTRLIAPCCHDTASAIAAVPDAGDDWGYISSGTWSLVGTLLDKPVNSAAAREANFTNLGGADGKICFHKNVNGMWLLRQCMEWWEDQGAPWEIASLVEASRAFGAKGFVLEVDDPELLLQGRMPERINAQLRRRGLPEFSAGSADAPELASFLFHSLAARYGEVFRMVGEITGKALRKVYVFGGASQNEFLNGLTVQATGLPVHRAGTEGSTVGNFAVQLASLEGGKAGEWAAVLQPRE